MSAWTRFPFIYEINTWVWLRELSERCGQPTTLANVPATELDRLAGDGFDAVWLMGVWERSPQSAQIARAHPDLQDEFHRALPDLRPDDVVGSPYAVHRYVVDARLGGPAGLAAIRQALAARGVKLILDFVPNHIAVDHPWTVEHPDWLIQGAEEDLQRAPNAYFAVEADGKRFVYAHGRDPYFPAWTDTAQLNVANPALRQALVETLLNIASQCDGVRCDMAMLTTNDIFNRTWGERGYAGDQPDFWAFVVPQIKAAHPEFLFVAEVYWDLEWTLQQQGFDYTYDKRLYDRLRQPDTRPVRDHLRADMAYQERLVRYFENHDEPRAAAVFGAERSKSVAVLTLTLPGARLLHEGQFEGRTSKVPVQLGRRLAERAHDSLPHFYRRLMAEVTQPIYHEGEWALMELFACWKANTTYTNLTAHSWQHGDDYRLVVVNLMPTQSQGMIHLPQLELAGKRWVFHDVMNEVSYHRDGDELAVRGLYVDLPGYGFHLFHVRPA